MVKFIQISLNTLSFKLIKKDLKVVIIIHLLNQCILQLFLIQILNCYYEIKLGLHLLDLFYLYSLISIILLNPMFNLLFMAHFKFLTFQHVKSHLSMAQILFHISLSFHSILSLLFKQMDKFYLYILSLYLIINYIYNYL